MGVGHRPAACASCSKRLNYKQWYYRNGKHFCNRRCWMTEHDKAAQEQTKESSKAPQPAEAAAPKEKEPIKKAPAKEAAS